jgi:NAD(P)-dependent dehydrogenase (short-subunit alcohol dehydrogenase family)
MSVAGQIVLITGAAGSLGRAAAAAFAESGARLVLLDIAAKGLNASYGPENDTVLPFVVDLADRPALGMAVAKAKAKFGGIDVVCNIAGGFNMGPAVHETTHEFWSRLMDLNAGSVLNVARAVVPEMIAAKSGKIVNVAAMNGTIGKANMSAYSASKSVVIRLTESMSAELRDYGINVNCVLPSIIDTAPNRKDMPGADFSRWVSPRALADVVVFLASDKARAIHGASVPVVGLS